MKKSVSLLSITLALACAGAIAQDRAAESSTKRSGTTEAKPAAADSKSRNAEDRKLLAAVRRAVVADKSISRSGHNVKMSTSAGVVTLRGTVPSEDEKTKIEQLAKNVSGVSSVENNLEVKAERTTRKGTSDSTARTGPDSSPKDTKAN